MAMALTLAKTQADFGDEIVYAYSDHVKEQIAKLTRATLKDLATKPDGRQKARALFMGIRRALDERMGRSSDIPAHPIDIDQDLFSLGASLGDAVQLS